MGAYKNRGGYIFVMTSIYPYLNSQLHTLFSQDIAYTLPIIRSYAAYPPILPSSPNLKRPLLRAQVKHGTTSIIHLLVTIPSTDIHLSTVEAGVGIGKKGGKLLVRYQFGHGIEKI